MLPRVGLVLPRWDARLRGPGCSRASFGWQVPSIRCNIPDNDRAEDQKHDSDSTEYETGGELAHGSRLALTLILGSRCIST
jgi:hypothetical protein